MNWWHDPDAHWRATLAADLFPGIPTDTPERGPAYEAVVSDHRLAPWLHARKVAERTDWAAEARDAMARALQQQQTLIRILDICEARGAAPVLLKGSPLALFAYAQPWHRPMRDLDLLVETPELALGVQDALLEQGFATHDEQAGDAAALLGERHQLPVLVAPDGITFVELHLRLFHGDTNEATLTAAVDREAFGRSVRVLSPEAQIVHLVGHAARDHRFDNGPQVIVDLAMLWQSEQIDHDRLQRLAAASGLARHHALLEKMARDAFPGVGPGKAHAPDLDVAAALAWRLMTSPPGDVASARDRRETRGSSPSRLFSRLFPSPARLASAQGEAGSAGALLGQYARHYARLATQRLPRMLESSSSDEDLAALIDWLEA